MRFNTERFENLQNFDKKRLVKPAVGALVLAFAAVAGMDSFYIVKPSEAANVRRFNDPVYALPVGQGTHFKLPFIDVVDKSQISLRTIHIPAFSVNTVDNQKITLEMNFNYHLPIDKVNHILYEVGDVDDGDNDNIDDSIIPVAKDRAARVFAQQNTTNVSLDREKIQAQIEKDVFATVRQLFGIAPQSLQFAKIQYSKAFVESNELAVANKNQVTAEVNKQNSEAARARQAFADAKGDADSSIEKAKGDAKAMILEAKANKTAQELEGQGQAERLRKEMVPFGSPEAYIRYLQKQAALKWNGQKPQVEVSGTGGGQTAIVVPMPK